MQKQKNKTTDKSINSIKGFSLVELIIVIIMSSISLSLVMFQLKGVYLNMKPDEVMSDLINKLDRARSEAISGIADQQRRTFDLKSFSAPHDGIQISTIPIVGSNNCESSCSGTQNSICISGQTFCYVNESSFTFNRFSGKTANTHIIFINSSDRKLAILITEYGQSYIIELINGYWHSRKELQNLTSQASSKG